jgi:hypothetical protein
VRRRSKRRDARSDTSSRARQVDDKLDTLTGCEEVTRFTQNRRRPVIPDKPVRAPRPVVSQPTPQPQPQPSQPPQPSPQPTPQPQPQPVNTRPAGPPGGVLSAVGDTNYDNYRATIDQFAVPWLDSYWSQVIGARYHNGLNQIYGVASGDYVFCNGAIQPLQQNLEYWRSEPAGRHALPAAGDHGSCVAIPR